MNQSNLDAVSITSQPDNEWDLNRCIEEFLKADRESVDLFNNSYWWGGEPGIEARLSFVEWRAMKTATLMVIIGKHIVALEHAAAKE